MDWKYWLLVLVVVAASCISARVVRLIMRIRKELEECTTHKEAGLIAHRADALGFSVLWSHAKAKEQRLFTEFLSEREEQFKMDLENAVGSEEKLFAVLNDRKYSDHVDPHFNSRVGKMVREQLRPFTEKRIIEATSYNDLLFLLGGRWCLKHLFFRRGFNRIDEPLKEVFSRKARQLACSEAIASTTQLDICFNVKTGDDELDALIAMKKNFLELPSNIRASVGIAPLYKEINSALQQLSLQICES